MSLGVQGTFGILPFTCSTVAVQTFQNVRLEHTARYAVHNVIGSTPVSEYIGPGQKKISFKVHLNADFCVSIIATLELVKNMLESGTSHPLLFGTEYVGKFYLRGFTEDRTLFNGLGLPVVEDLTLSLEEDKAFSLTDAVTSAISSLF